MAVPENSANKRICLGVIVAVHGVRGLVKVKPFTETPEALTAYGPLGDAAGVRFWQATLKGLQKGNALLALSGVETLGQAICWRWANPVHVAASSPSRRPWCRRWISRRGVWWSTCRRKPEILHRHGTGPIIGLDEGGAKRHNTGLPKPGGPLVVPKDAL